MLKCAAIGIVIGMVSSIFYPHHAMACILISNVALGIGLLLGKSEAN